MAEPEEDIKQEFAGVSKQTKSENQIIYICDFRRYEKSSSKNILLQSRSSQTTNIDDLILGLLFPGCPGKLVERFGEEDRRDRSNSSQSFKKQLHRKPKPSGDFPNHSNNKQQFFSYSQSTAPEESLTPIFVASEQGLDASV